MENKRQNWPSGIQRKKCSEKVNNLIVVKSNEPWGTEPYLGQFPTKKIAEVV